jgi:hypothetical protein
MEVETVRAKKTPYVRRSGVRKGWHARNEVAGIVPTKLTPDVSANQWVEPSIAGPSGSHEDRIPAVS